jgi:hypothetical protein
VVVTPPWIDPGRPSARGFPDSAAGDGGGVGLTQTLELRGRGLERGPRVPAPPGGLQGQAEVEERERTAFGQPVRLSDLDRFAQRGGARLEMLRGVVGVFLGQAPPHNTHIVSGDAPRDGALFVAPGQRGLEEGDGFLELRAGLSEVGERGGEVVQSAGAPAALIMNAEVIEGRLEGGPRPGEVRGWPFGAEEDAEVVLETGALEIRGKGQLRQQGPEVVAQGARRGGLFRLGQLFLKAKPVPVRRFGVGAKRLPETPEQVLEVLADGQRLRSGVGVQVTAG